VHIYRIDTRSSHVHHMSCNESSGQATSFAARAVVWWQQACALLAGVRAQSFAKTFIVRIIAADQIQQHLNVRQTPLHHSKARLQASSRSPTAFNSTSASAQASSLFAQASSAISDAVRATLASSEEASRSFFDAAKERVASESCCRAACAAASADKTSRVEGGAP
jgi:hypothetical protein